MGGVQTRGSLDADRLRKIHHGLRSSLRIRNFGEDLIDRCAEDAIGKALIELTEAEKEGKEVPDPVAWVIKVAIWRAIDRLRQEERQAAAPLSEEVLAELAERPAALPDEAALDHVEARELHQAVAELPEDQRQAVRSYYFLELSTRAGARYLHWSEPTFRRRLAAAMDCLKERFGIPEQGDALGIEVGLAAAVSLRGIGSPAAALADQAVAAMETGYHAVARIPARLRDLFSSLWRAPRRGSDRLQLVLSDRSAESRRSLDPALVGRAAEAASSPGGASLAKAICGGGAAVAAVCLAIVLAPAGEQPHHRHPQPPLEQHRQIPKERALPQPPSSTAAVAPAVPAPTGGGGHAEGQHRHKAAAKPDRSPTSNEHERALGDESGSTQERTRAAISSLGVESSAAPPAPASSVPAPSESSPAPVESAPPETPTQEANQDLGMGP